MQKSCVPDGGHVDVVLEVGGKLDLGDARPGGVGLLDSWTTGRRASSLRPPNPQSRPGDGRGR